MSTSHKFWDSDLRRDPSLLSVAIAYARDYTGDFEFLVNAQQVVIDTGSLPLATARAVLNCMRADPSVVAPSKPPPQRYAPTRERAYADNVVPIRPEPKPVRVVRDYPVTLKREFGVASQGARVIHRPKEAEARWHRGWLRYEERYADSLEFDYLSVMWWCGRTTRNPILLTAYQIGTNNHYKDLPNCKGGCFE